MGGHPDYKFIFTWDDHKDLSDRLHAFENCLVVIRHSDHPLYRTLHEKWNWLEIGGRNQANKEISECLIMNREPEKPSEGLLF